MNKTRSKNKYKFYCTADPNTWETYNTNIQEPADLGENRKESENYVRGGAKGRLGGGKRGEGGGAQRVPDNGWEGRKANMRVEGSRSNNNMQIEDHNHGNVFGNGNGNRDKETDTVKQSNGRKYKVGVQKDTGMLQTTLNEFWIGKEKDM